jgi:trans-aconitate 2-methyltransferase
MTPFPPTPPSPQRDPQQNPQWDPARYARHSAHRNRPLTDLLARVPPLPDDARPRIADLGCGHGTPTLQLAARWPAAHITGYDNSPQMLDAARPHAGPTPAGGTVDFAHADLATWTPGDDDRFDLLFSNAALQWVPGHTARFRDWTDALPPGGVLAFQVPGNFDAPSHTLLHELRNSPRWRDRLRAASRAPSVLDPADYLAELDALGCDVDAWETTYLQVLHGENPVLDWVEGTALRPVLTALADDPEARDAFLDTYGRALRESYPPLPADPGRTVFPFRRVFAVAVKR